MKYTFSLRGRPVSLALLDAVAVRPTAELRSQLSPARLAARFGTPAPDDRGGGSPGQVLPARNRKLFERAGWVFVLPSPAVAQALAAGTTVPGAVAIRRVYLGRGGTLIGSDRAAARLEPDVGAAAVAARFQADGLTVVRRLRFAPNLFEVRLPPARPELESIGALQASGRYRFIEPALVEAIGARLTPTDPNYRDQWHHVNDGSNGGTAGADIRSEPAWDLTRGAGVRLAVIDNGFHVNHPDLRDGIVGGGHFVEDGLGGAAFQPWAPGAAGFPAAVHGTLCLGMAGARMNNGRGGCGSAPEADLLPVACMPDQVGTQLTLARAVAYAADPTTEDAAADPAGGAHVIACSVGPNGGDWLMTSALELAISAAATAGRGGLGVPIFWAATNGPYDIASDEVCSHPDVLAVSRSNRLDEQDGAGFGPKLEFLAPGAAVYSTKTATGFGFATGCSYAAPLAAGVAALVLARHPGWTRDQVRQRLRDSCDKVGGVTYDAAGRHDEYGWGRINAERAVQ